MADILVLYGSYRRGRAGIRLARWLVARLNGLGQRAGLVDAREIGLPMLDLRLSDYPEGEAPEAMVRLAGRLKAADGFVFVVGEYNHGVQPGLKNLVDHYYAEWAGRPAALVSYSSGRISGARSAYAWREILGAVGTTVVPATLAVGQIGAALDGDSTPAGEGGALLERQFPKFAEGFLHWVEAARTRRGGG